MWLLLLLLLLCDNIDQVVTDRNKVLGLYHGKYFHAASVHFLFILEMLRSSYDRIVWVCVSLSSIPCIFVRTCKPLIWFLVYLMLWFAGKDMGTFYWHGRDNTTIKELNPKVLYISFLLHKLLCRKTLVFYFYEYL